MDQAGGSHNQNRQELARAALEGLYLACAELAAERALACAKKCSVCCTGRVLMTGLEALVLGKALQDQGREDLLQRILDTPVDPRARPASTMNSLAADILARREPPPELEPDSPPGVCPLLEDGLCAVYEARPLACRTMVSLVRCQPGGQASEEDLWLGVASAFFQMAEQIALGWDFGLMPEVMRAKLQPRESGRNPALLTCQVLPGLPTPPKHQAKMQSIMQRIFARQVGGVPLGRRLDELRQ